MDLGIGGKTALVLGAGGGLGSAIAAALAREGARVALADIDKGALERCSGAITKTSGSVMTVPWNLADLSVIDRNVGAIEQSFGPVEILINNTGGPPPTAASGLDPSIWSVNFQAMVLSVIALTDRVLPVMRVRKWGRVITSTSSGVVSPIPNLGISNALRLSLVGWSKTLAHEIGGDGVTANIVLPGRIATDRIRFLDGKKAEREGRSTEAVAKDSVRSIPLGRYGRPEEYADVVAFLASDRAAYLTGSVIRVDGGMITSI
jgi:3-oxoacyl-[acyl-carrier protein] reductase